MSLLITNIVSLFSIYGINDAYKKIDSGFISIVMNGIAYQENTKADTIMLADSIQDLEILLSDDFINTYSHYHVPSLDDRPNRLYYPHIRYNNITKGLHTLNLGRYLGDQFVIQKSISFNKEEKEGSSNWIMTAIYIYGLLLLMSGVFFYFLYQIRKKLQLAQLRNNIAADLHDEVGSNLSSISMFALALERVLTDKTDDVKEVLKKIQESSNVSIVNLRDTVWSINPDNDRNLKVCQKLESYGREIFGSSSTKFEYRNTYEKIDEVALNMEQRRNLYLILKEGLHNIVKHAKASNVSLDIKKEKKQLVIVLNDDGIGIDKQANDGMGLKTMKTRADKNGFDFELETSQKGTKIRLVIDAN